jgi:hypothetical protein
LKVKEKNLIISSLGMNTNDKKSLNQIFNAIAEEIETLKCSIDLHQSKVEEQEKKLNALEYKMLMKENKNKPL